MSEENSNQPISDAAELQKRYASGEKNFKKANLVGADLRDTDLRGADLQGANLKGANLRGANLKGANLQGANLKESDLRGTSLIAANLKAATLCGASMELAMLQEADLQRANLRGANLGGATLVGANLEKTELTFTDFSDTYMINQGSRGGANLSKASFKGANLKGTNFQGANLKGANLQESNLKDAYPQGANYDWTTRFPNNFDPVKSGMEKAHTSTKQRNSSTSRLNPIPVIAAVVLVGVPVCVLSVHKLVESNKTKPVASETAEPETEVSFDANQKAEVATDGKDSINVGSGDAETASVINSLADRQKKLDVLAGTINKTSTVKPKTAATTPKVQKAKTTSSPKRSTNACPALVRAINAANPNTPSSVDIIINAQKAIANVPFTQASRYVSVPSGLLFVQIVKAGTKKIVAQRTFTATPNGAYSIAVTGPLRGQYGQMLFNESPFVIQENLSQPKSGKFKGRFYNLSETKDTTNLRIVESDTPKVAVVQPVKLMPKTVVDYPQLDAGSYNFNPLLPNKSEPLINSAYKPPIRVEIAKAKIPAGTIFDVIAVGNRLGKGQNSLKLSAASYKALPSTKAGCMRIQ